MAVVESQKRAKDAWFECDGLKALLQKLQVGQQWYQDAVLGQVEKSALDAWPVADRNNFTWQFNTLHKKLFKGLVRAFVDGGRN